MQAKLEGRRPETEEDLEYEYPAGFVYGVFLTADWAGVPFGFLAADLCFDKPGIWADD